VFGGSAVRLFGPQPHGPITSRFAAFVSTSFTYPQIPQISPIRYRATG